MNNNSVLACILAFYPGDGFEDICRAIARNVTFLLVVDNSPDSSLSKTNINLPSNSFVVYNKNNGAVAGALNIALNLARRNKYNYLQVFDQDTQPKFGTTLSLIETLKLNPEVVIVAPRFINMNTRHPGRVMKNISKWRVKNIWPKENIGLVDVLFAINSASIINIERLPHDIYYDERLIIDGCDIDFCLALKQRNLKILVDTSQCIVHGIGSREDGAGRWSPTNYSPYRKYLGAKNRLIVWRRYYKKFPGFVFNDCWIFLLDSARTILLEGGKVEKLKAIVKGVKDGLNEKDITVRTHKARFPFINDKIDPRLPAKYKLN